MIAVEHLVVMPVKCYRNWFVNETDIFQFFELIFYEDPYNVLERQLSIVLKYDRAFSPVVSFLLPLLLT
jgi:hypothetical protein